MASYSLMAYATGLVSFMLVKVLATSLLAAEDTKRLVKFGIIAMVSNMVFNIALAIPFSYVGWLWQPQASAAINAGLLGFTLYKEGVLKAQLRAPLAFYCSGYFGNGSHDRRYSMVEPGC